MLDVVYTKYLSLFGVTMPHLASVSMSGQVLYLFSWMIDVYTTLCFHRVLYDTAAAVEWSSSIIAMPSVTNRYPIVDLL
jgi:hypothetical protein